MQHADFVAFLGRLHPAIVHLPIGLLAAVALLEFLGLVNRKAALRSAPASLVIVAALAAIAAAVSGTLLAREPDYGGDTLELHRWLGISVAALCTIAAAFRVACRGGARLVALRWYRFTLLAALGVVGVTGHLGGSMTYGDDFLTQPLFGGAAAAHEPQGTVPRNAATSAATSAPASAPALGPASQPAAGGPPFTAVSAFLEQRCTSCHGASRQRGGLALNTPAAIAAGGEDGAVIVPGDPATSELMIRLRRPLEEHGHMPPKSKPQPGDAELALIEQWIRAGAHGIPTPAPRGATEPSSDDANSPVDDSGEPPTAAGEPVNRSSSGADPGSAAATPAGAPAPDAAAAAAVPAPADGAIAALQGVLAYVAPIGQGSSLLAVDFSAARATLSAAEIAELLRPLAGNIADLKIARRTLDDSIAPVIAAMPRLRELDLRGSTLSEACARAVGALPALETLELVGTTIPAAAARQIAAAPTLRRAYTWKSNLTAADIAAIRAAQPKLVIDAGDVETAAALEIEPDIKFTSDAPVPAARSNPADAAAALKAINAVCPVSGKPVDPRYLIVYEGKVIGFCCPNCPTEFWKDPVKYAIK